METKSLGYASGNREIRPLMDQIKALVESPVPKTKATKVLPSTDKLIPVFCPTLLMNATSLADKMLNTGPESMQ